MKAPIWILSWAHLTTEVAAEWQLEFNWNRKITFYDVCSKADSILGDAQDSCITYVEDAEESERVERLWY